MGEEPTQMVHFSPQAHISLHTNFILSQKEKNKNKNGSCLTGDCYLLWPKNSYNAQYLPSFSIIIYFCHKKKSWGEGHPKLLFYFV